MNPIRSVLNISLSESSHHIALIATHLRYLRAVQTYLNCATACYSLHCEPYFSFKPWCWSLHMWLLLPGLGKKCQFSSNSSTRGTWTWRTLKFTKLFVDLIGLALWTKSSFRFRKATTPHTFSGALVTLHQCWQPSYTGCDLTKRSGFREIISNKSTTFPPASGLHSLFTVG